MNIFRDREEAGRCLAEALMGLKSKGQPLVLAIPRGGVLVGKALARELHLPLDVIVTRKIGAPSVPELAIGATTSNGGTLWSEDSIREFGIGEELKRAEERLQVEEAMRRETLYRKGRPPLNLTGKTVVLVDDGAATGLTMEAAIRAVKNGHAAEIIVAVPVAPPDVATRLRDMVDRFVILATPDPFYAVSRFYEYFDQVTDSEVEEILQGNVGRLRNGTH